ncbi:uncharacterized protein [Venturia canescens]|uniref:uncharacterized protein n=1 Tax=Venturia canescens TaxID=32260 RepID=UPI001C9C1F0F|nr:uncharacterized protein LOC122415296 [Venturia canescens]
MLKQLGGWKSSSIAEGYIENSLLNRQKIFDKITHAAKANTQLNPQPSASGTDTTKPRSSDQKQESLPMELESDNFFDDFDLDDDTLAAIDKSFASEKPKSSLPSFTTGNNEEIIITSNLETVQPCHFLKKPPISVFSHGKENQPPEKRFKVQQLNNANNNVKAVFTSTNFVTNQQKSESTFSKNETKKLTSETTSTNFKTNEMVPESTSVEKITSKNPNVKYENCVFHGNIINNFYFSNGKTPEENV